MTIIVHQPITQTAQDELIRRSTKFHADQIIANINSLSCSDEQKMQLFDAVTTYIRQSNK